eukprot:6089803-Amphidinium_carterae.2
MARMLVAVQQPDDDGMVFDRLLWDGDDHRDSCNSCGVCNHARGLVCNFRGATALNMARRHNHPRKYF